MHSVQTPSVPAPIDHQPIMLSDGAPVPLPVGPGAWNVTGGRVEAYLVWPEGRRLLGVADEGSQVFSVSPDCQASIQLIAPEGASLAPRSPDPSAVDRWLRQAAGTIAASGPAPEAPCSGEVDPTEILSGGAGVLWLSPQTGLTLDFGDVGEMILAPDIVPVAGAVQARALSRGTIVVHRTADLAPEQILSGLSIFAEGLVRVFSARSDAADAAAITRLTHGTTVGPGAQGSRTEAIAAISSALGIKLADQPRLPPEAETLPLAALCRVAGLRARRITLEEDWQNRDQGPLLVRKADDETVYSLIWDGRAYLDHDGLRISATRSADYQHSAHTVSAPLPAHVKGLWSLAIHVMRSGNGRDALWAAGAAAGAAALGILVPLATAWLLSDIVPAGIVGLLVAVGLALAASALITSVFSTARSIATTRIEGRGATVLGAGVTDRLLRLPARFFKEFAAGDLNQRIENVEAMRQLAVSILMSAGLTAVLSVTYLVVLFFYDIRLALIGAALVMVYIFAVTMARVLQMEAIREAATLDGEIASLTYETLDGVGKLRTSAAEERAMARWLDVYARERAADVRAGRVSTNFGAFADAYQTITLMTLFAGAGVLAILEAPAGVFIAFLSAFGSFQGAFIGLSEAMLQVYSAQPLVERARPILEATTEVDPGRGDPGTLRGDIEGSGIVFSYGEGLPAILDGLDFHVRPGEHMAIVGSSGSGKSTLLRLLLGFETPRAGSILYDGQDLTRLDLTRVRSQIGVVLQASQLFAGSILENIRGAGNATLEGCMAAAERAGLARDLEYFAMGMHTPITEGAGTLSGGQRQRILIARALAAKPNILLFDEATSALDNATQALVSQTLDGLKVTRVTIAHRLSTVRHADRICVLQGGRFVEQGTFDELMAMDGVFTGLAQRQLTED